MKRFKYIIYMVAALLTTGLSGCEQSLPLYDNPNNMLNFDFVIYKSDEPNKETPFSFVFSNSTTGYDTIWVDIKTVGFPSDQDRPFELEQVKSEKLDAVPNVHYVSFDNAELKQKFYYIPAGKVKARIPVVVKQDPSMQTADYKLYFTFKDNGYFRAGYPRYSIKRLSINDMVSKPAQWSYAMNYYFTKYSTAAHIFMIKATGFKWDDEFISRVVKNFEYAVYLNRLIRKKLDETNKERAAQGLGPLTGIVDDKEVPITFTEL